MTAKTALRPATLSRLLAEYAPQAGVADEMVDAGGGLRPGWAALLAHLDAAGPDALAAAFGRGDQYLRDAGVFYRLYAETGSTERDWPFAHLPVIVHETEWSGIAEGLVQRAELLERIVADLYGPGRLVSDGHLPAGLVAGNPEWLRPLVGVAPAGGHFLHLIAFEIGRNPDGSWFVLGDRTQAPSGAGFALENRVASTRIFPDLFGQSRIHRLAGFFRSFQTALNGLRGADSAQVGILSPGPLNDTYFEHAYIARYLGFMLLEGEDLVVREGRVMVRTVTGLSPIDVLWRRLDSRFADPLELDPASQIGTPGLVAAARAGRLAMVNALGSGVLEMRALLAFLPRLSEHLLAEPLKLPNIATWWCGHAAERAHVAANAADLVISPALSNRLPFDLEEARVPGARFRPGPHATLADWIEAEGPALVGQETVSVSTAPVWDGGRLLARPMSLRAFALRTAEGWRIMPGGFARIGRSSEPTAIALQQGGTVADVWIVSDATVPPDTMVPAAGRALRREASLLPARAADNLHWLGRYVERAETAVRLLRAYHLRRAETGTPDNPLLETLRGHLAAQGLDAEAPLAPALAGRIAQAQGCAGKVRDRFSTDGWAALADLARAVAEIPPETARDEAARALGRLLHRIAAFSGLVHENMHRSTGWRFLTLGRAIERADSLAWALAVFARPEAPDGGLDLVVELGDSVMTHRRRFAIATNRDTVIDLLALDPANPRAIAFQLAEIRTQIARLPGEAPDEPPSPLSRAAQRLQADLLTLTADAVTTDDLLRLREGLAALSTTLAARYLA